MNMQKFHKRDRLLGGMPMTILALDTATSILSIALSSQAPSSRRALWYFEMDAGLKHSESLMEGADMLLKTAGLNREDLDLIACMRGPGSFTGLRIGFSVGKGLALARGIPLVSVPTLDCMAYSHGIWPGAVLPVIDARKGRYFTALFQGAERISPYMDTDAGKIGELISRPPGIGPLLITGPDAYIVKDEVEKILPSGRHFPERMAVDPCYNSGKSKELLEIAEKKFILEKENDVLRGPEYLRKSDAELFFIP
jgi:tRNA threonylcarbamoyladenosine biosynthesis protein TsaB